jgi:chemotaxis protein MotB
MHTAFTTKNNKRAVVEAVKKDNNSAVESPIHEKDQFAALIQALSALQDSDYHMNPQDGWVELDIKAGALFDSGSANLRPIAVLKLMKLASIIKKIPYPIAIEGYTDNMPISTEQYPSNWELSAARAASVARCLTSFGVEQNQMSVTGYGERYPVANNTTEEGRARNRRVNVIIAKDKLVPLLLNPALSVNNEKPQEPEAVKNSNNKIDLPQNNSNKIESTNMNNKEITP